MNRMVKLNAGFTLTEALVVLCILGIVFSVMVPAYQVYMDHLRLRTTSNDLVMSLQLARSEAVRTRVSTSVCSVASAQSCQSASAWNNGWFMPARGHLWQPEQGVQVTPNLNGVVAFNAMGGLVEGSTYELDVTGPRGSRCVRIGYIGRVRIHQGGC